ncbi:hypothetical protein D9M68_447670 [compost metagenome]
MLRQRHLNAEHRPSSWLRAYCYRIAENSRDPLDDRQPEADPLALAGAPDAQLVEFEKDTVQLILWNTFTAVPHLQLQVLATFARAQQDAPLLGITTGVAEKIAQDPRQQAEVGTDRVIGNADFQPQALGRRNGLELRGQRRQQFIQVIHIDIRLDRRLIQFGDIQQVGE